MCMWEKMSLMAQDSQSACSVALYLHPQLHCYNIIATQKASVGMYCGCDYPYKSYSLCTF